MVQALVDISDDANYIINLVKAKYRLKDKSQAIDRMAEEYGRELLEPELRPEFIRRLRKIEKEKTIKIKDVDEYFSSMRR